MTYTLVLVGINLLCAAANIPGILEGSELSMFACTFCFSMAIAIGFWGK